MYSNQDFPLLMGAPNRRTEEQKVSCRTRVIRPRRTRACWGFLKLWRTAQKWIFMLLSRWEAPHSGDVSELFSLYLFLLGSTIDETLLKSYICLCFKHVQVWNTPACWCCCQDILQIIGLCTLGLLPPEVRLFIILLLSPSFGLNRILRDLKTGMFQKMYI